MSDVFWLVLNKNVTAGVGKTLSFLLVSTFCNVYGVGRSCSVWNTSCHLRTIYVSRRQEVLLKLADFPSVAGSRALLCGLLWNLGVWSLFLQLFLKGSDTHKCNLDLGPVIWRNFALTMCMKFRLFCVSAEHQQNCSCSTLYSHRLSWCQFVMNFQNNQCPGYNVLLVVSKGYLHSAQVFILKSCNTVFFYAGTNETAAVAATTARCPSTVRSLTAF